MLRGRASECAQLDELLAAARAGRSSALVLRGEAGIGKTSLLDYDAAGNGSARVLRAAGFEAEMELPFAAIHQLCAPLLDQADRLPAPQRDALQTPLGLSSGSQPDPFLVGLAVLTLFSDAAETQPLVCLVDDAQWLDHASAHVLAFVARRLEAESVFMLFAERDSDRESKVSALVVDAVPRVASLGAPVRGRDRVPRAAGRPCLSSLAWLRPAILYRRPMDLLRERRHAGGGSRQILSSHGCVLGRRGSVRPRRCLVRLSRRVMA